MSDSKLMDIEPGGEQTQYEGVRQFSVTPAKETGQLGGGLPHTKSEMRTKIGDDNTEARDRRDEARFAHKLERGEGTTGISGYTNSGPVNIPFLIKLLYVTCLCGKQTREPEAEADDNVHDKVETDDDAAKSRREQGYGPGSGVGA
ncbi:hypothetical protein BDW69DRAFT_181161 [Aspergillus filifer]